MDLEALDSPERIGNEETLLDQVEEEEVPLVMVEEAQPGVPDELSPSNIMTRC